MYVIVMSSIYSMLCTVFITGKCVSIVKLGYTSRLERTHQGIHQIPTHIRCVMHVLGSENVFKLCYKCKIIAEINVRV